MNHQLRITNNLGLAQFGINRLGGGFKYFWCSPLFGEDSHFEYIQMGWNHQLVDMYRIILNLAHVFFPRTEKNLSNSLHLPEAMGQVDRR